MKQDFIATQNAESCRTLYTKYGLRNVVPLLKKEHAFLNVVHSSPLKNTALRLTQSIKSYQDSRKGRCKGKPRGWPRFRAWRNDWFSLLYDEPNKGFKVVGKDLQLSLGSGNASDSRKLIIPLQHSEALNGKVIKNCQISKTGTEYYALFNIEQDCVSPKIVNRFIAFDPNHKNLLYGVDNACNAIEVAGLDWLKNFDKRIDELKSKRDRCNKKAKLVEVLDYTAMPIGKQRWQPSKRWTKYDIALQKTYAKRREQIKTFCYTLANALCRKYDLISVGDYTPHGGGLTTKMRRAMNNRSVIGKFKSILSWVAFKSGKSYMEYVESGTTRTCHNCKAIVLGGLPPDIRQWQCQTCYMQHHRDENAAINGFYKTLTAISDNSKYDNTIFANLLATVPGSGPVISVDKRWAWSVLPRGVFYIPRGQDCGITASSKKLNRQCGNCLPKHDQAA